MVQSEEAYLKSTREYWNKHRKEDEPRDGDVLSTKIDDILGLFLIEMERELSAGALRYLQELLLDMRVAINELKSTGNYCQTQGGSELPMLMNDIFLERFQAM